MRLFCFVAVLLLSTVGESLCQSTGNHLADPRAKRNFIGLNHIEIDLGQRNTLLIGFDRYEQVQAHKNVDSVLRLFVDDYRNVVDTAQSPTRSVHTLFKLRPDNRDMALRSAPQSTTDFRFRDGESPVEVKTKQDTVLAVWMSTSARELPTDFAVYFFVNNLRDLEGILKAGGVNAKVEQALESVRGFKHHNLTNPRYAFNLIQPLNGKPTFQTPGLIGDPFLSFRPGIGVGLIRNQWVPSFNFDLEIVPTRFQQVGYFVGYTSNFFFRTAADNSFQTFRNDFVRAGVSFYRKDKGSRTSNFSKHIASFYVGLPVHRSGSFFAPNTVNVGAIVYQNWLLKVQADVYMNGFFRQVNPGLRLVVGF
jgi:hypothetical protein